MKRILAGLVILTLIGLAFLNTAKPPTQYESTGKISVENQGIVDFGQQQSAYFMLKSETEVPIKVNLTWRILTRPIPSEIFLLESPRIDANNYAEFKTALNAELTAQQRRLSSVTLQEMDSLPAQSILIIASGALPEELLNGKLEQLIKKNQTLIFIGLPFEVTLGKDGTPQKNKTTWKNASQKLGFDFTETNPGKPENHQLIRSLYGIQLNGNNNATQIHIEDDAILGINYQNQGTLAFIPNTLDSGWTSGQKAAQEIAQIINKGEWQPILAYEKQTTDLKTGLNTIYSPSFEERNAYAQLELTTQNKSYLFHQYLQALSGKIRITDEASPGQNVSLSAELNENYNEPRQITLNLEIQKDGQPTTRQTIGTISVKTIGYASTSIQANQTPGDYLLLLKDDANKAYAQALLHVKNESIDFLREDYGSGAFSLKLLKDGQPQTNEPLQISIDEGQNKTVITDGAGIASFNAHITVQPTHNIQIIGQDIYLELKRPHVDPSIFNSPIIWAGILLILAIFSFGYFFAVQTRPKVWIDIPDFTPENNKKTGITTENIFRAFETANKKYGRTHSPLSLEEVKDAIKEELQLPSRTTLTDQNVAEILAILENKRKITSPNNLFLLTEWANKSRKTPQQLALKRLVIDELIKAGLPFEETAKADLTVNQVQLHLYEKNALSKLQKALGKGRNVLVLPTEKDVSNLLTTLRNATDALSVVLYLEFQHGTFQIIPVDLLTTEIKK